MIVYHADIGQAW